MNTSSGINSPWHPCNNPIRDSTPKREKELLDEAHREQMELLSRGGSGVPVGIAAAIASIARLYPQAHAQATSCRIEILFGKKIFSAIHDGKVLAQVEME